LETEPFFTLFEYWPLCYIDPNQNNPPTHDLRPAQLPNQTLKHAKTCNLRTVAWI
jgi:hypothetical protein